MKEIWKDIPGYEGYYQVSNIGNVKSLERKDTIGRRVHEKILTVNISKKGYARVRLYKNDSKVMYSIHRLVALTFIPTVKNKTEVNHIDENKLNNHVDNLEWCNRSENVNHGNRSLKMAITTGHSITNGSSIYHSIQSASKALNIPRTTLRSWLKKRYNRVEVYE